MTITAIIAIAAAPMLALAAVPAAQFSLASKTFSDGATMPKSTEANIYGCTGPNQAPELHWSGAPTGTKSFALVMHDPDAPVAGGFWHWIVFNIPPSTINMGSGGTSHKGLVSGTTSTGASGYVGPCPPPGKPHHYVFSLYALDIATVRGVDASTTGSQALAAIKGHVLGTATITGLYGR